MEEDEKLPELPSARPEFTKLSEAEVWEAIDGDTYGENPITAEVTRLVARYTVRFKACVGRHGNVPPHILLVQVRWPIERVAVLLLVGFVEAEAVAAGGRFTLH